VRDDGSELDLNPFEDRRIPSEQSCGAAARHWHQYSL
jgi:hypothetical protein